MCGAESASLEPRKVSGSVLRVCNSCAGMGKQTSYRESVGHRAFVAQTLEKREQKKKRHTQTKKKRQTKSNKKKKKKKK